MVESSIKFSLLAFIVNDNFESVELIVPSEPTLVLDQVPDFSGHFFFQI